MKNWFSLYAIFTMLVLPGFSVAEEEGEEAPVSIMEEVVVTGTRFEQKVERIPANTTVIDQEDIKNSNAKTVVDLLRSEEGIVVRDLFGNGKTAQVDLRGFGETGTSNTLVLVDGRRVNAIDLSGVDWAQVPLEQIERVEIVRGTGTVLYGDNAVGGVINIITKIPSKELTYNAETIAGSYGRNKEQISVSGGQGNIGASLYASYDSTNGYRDNSEFRTKDIGGKIIFDPADFLSINLSGSYHSDNYGLPGDLSAAEVKIDRRSTNDPLDGSEIRDKYLKLGVDIDLGKYGGVVTDFSYRDREVESLFPDLVSPFASKGETDTWSITPRYIWDGRILDHGNTLIAGVDMYWSGLDLDAFSNYASPLLLPSGLTDIDRDSLGLYFSNEFALLENLFLSVGGRHERVRYDIEQQDLMWGYAGLDDKVTERENAYSAGLTFQYARKSSVFIRANRSLRFPLTDELVVYVFDPLESKILVNESLKPQRGKHYEVGIRHYFTPDIQGSLTLFRAEIKDEIFYDAIAWTNTNHPETLHQGIEVGSKAELWNKLTVFGNYTYERARFKKDPFEHKNIPAVPRHKGNLGFRIHDFVPGLIFSADYNFVSSSYAISDQENAFEKPDKYYTVNARLSYEWRWLKSFIGINNLTNKEYSEYAATGGSRLGFYPAPERNWVAGLRILF